MYYWNARALGDELRERRVSEDEKLRYLLVVTLAGLIFARPGVIGSINSSSDLLFTMSYIVISLAGIYSCFITNRAGDNRNFLDRFVCLSWPVLLRWFALFYGIYLSVSLINRMTGGYLATLSQVDPLILYMMYTLALQVVYFVWLKKFIGFASMPHGSTVEPLSV